MYSKWLRRGVEVCGRRGMTRQPSGGPRVLRDRLSRASTFHDTSLRVPPGGDQFLSSPYPKGTRFPHEVIHPTPLQEDPHPKIDPSTTSVILFPGQGTQYVGMAGDPNEMSRDVRELWDGASGILGYDLLKLCSEGPQEKLDLTVHCQPAVFVASLAAVLKLRETRPHVVEHCMATAGFSIGEITSLVFAGVLSFEDGVRLVKVRAEAMQLASELVPGRMATVLFGPDSKLKSGLLVAREWCGREFHIQDPVCSIANYLFPHGKVIGGNEEGIAFLEENYKDFRLKKVKRLPVSGAFHTRLMRPAVGPVREFLAQLAFNPPSVWVYSNLSGTRYNSVDELKVKLEQQLWKPVMWEQILHKLYERSTEEKFPMTFECGPGSSLSTVLKLVNAKAFKSSESIPP